MTDNITFERFERDCGFNQNERQRSNNPRLLYDFKVVIDGEWRAILKRGIGRGYEIYDADHRPIHGRNRSTHYAKHLGEEVEKQADFFQFVSDLLVMGRIPTLAEMAEKREQEAARAKEIDRQARQNIRNRVASAHGPELLEMLKLVHPILEGVNRRCTNETVMIQRVRALIAKAEDVGENFEDAVEQEIWSLTR